MLMKLRISLITTSSWGQSVPEALEQWAQALTLQSRRGIPVLGCFINLYCKKSLLPGLMSYPIFISVKARSKKPQFNLLKLIWLIFMVWRNKLHLDGEVEKDNTHLKTAFQIFFCQMQLHISYL